VQKGRQEGRVEGRREMLEQLLVERFGTVPPHVTDRLRAAPPERLTLWFRRALHATTLEDVFADATQAK
jgi:hypothetical protein